MLLADDVALVLTLMAGQQAQLDVLRNYSKAVGGSSMLTRHLRGRGSVSVTSPGALTVVGAGPRGRRDVLAASELAVAATQSCGIVSGPTSWSARGGTTSLKTTSLYIHGSPSLRQGIAVNADQNAVQITYELHHEDTASGPRNRWQFMLSLPRHGDAGGLRSNILLRTEMSVSHGVRNRN